MLSLQPLKIDARVSEEGKLMVTNPARWELIKRQFLGKDVTITLEEWVDKRSVDQNSFYWVYLGIIEQETGNDANAMHAFFKHKLIPSKFVTVFGETVEVEKSTTRLNKKEFSEYMEKICALTGVPIPDMDGRGPLDRPGKPEKPPTSLYFAK